ncbi:DUF3221 domain-containing protein [Bacillus sp. 179-C3.3 HS]|uniref:DUF3221 domain-containing protein n=1 Tax=Bacillus sp. 179-C3.3 HS TaxID=3232162 RepID=UPI0039A3BD92
MSIVIISFLLVGCVHGHFKKANTAPMQDIKDTTFSVRGILLYKKENVGFLLIHDKVPKKEDDFLEPNRLIDKYQSDLIVMDLSKVNTKKLKPGQKIDIWFDELKESLPPKTTVKKYKLINR